MDAIAQFISRAILQGTPLLYGATGEIITEKSGNLNLGIPGIMYIGAISGVIGGFFYQNESQSVSPLLAVIIPLLCCLFGSLLTSLLYCFLTVTLKANQNVTGLAITTFGVGFGNIFGGSLIKILKSDVPYLSLVKIAKAYKTTVFPFSDDMGSFGKMIFSHGFMVYLAIIIAVVAGIFLKRTRPGLHLRSVGENPATADAAGINVTLYKYLATSIGGMIAGLGGLFYIMDYSNGIWSNNGFGDRGWLAIAIVIFSIWILFNYINVPMTYIPLIQMLPYAVTIIVLIATSVRKKRENQPPHALGVTYFREER